MQYTLAQAKADLTASANAYGVTSLTNSINKAIRALASMTGWKCLRRVLRFQTAGPCFTLPQGCAGLVRVCVNGRPTTVRGQDFSFLQSGPGEAPAGFHDVPLSGVQDIGVSPIMVEPAREFRVFAYTDAALAGQPAVLITGVDPTGRKVSASVPVNLLPTYGSNGVLTAGAEPDDITPVVQPFSQITSVVLGANASAYVTLYAADAQDLTVRFPIALYHPDVKAPSFRRYLIRGVPPDVPLEVLAEVRIDPLPLVADTDVLPFDTIEPIEWMIRSDWCMKSGEPTQAKSYRDSAAAWLQAQEITDNTYQTQLTVNSIVEGSPGEISVESENV